MEIVADSAREGSEIGSGDQVECVAAWRLWGVYLENQSREAGWLE